MLGDLLVIGVLFGVLFGGLHVLNNMAEKKELEQKDGCCGGCCNHEENNESKGCCGGCKCGCQHDNDEDNE